MSTLLRPASSPHQLRLFAPDDPPPRPVGSAGQPSPDMRWSEYVERCALPWLAAHDAAPGTIEEYRESAALFAAICGDPALSRISAEEFRRFKETLRELPARRPRRIRGESYADHIRQCLTPSPRPAETDAACAARREWLSRQPRLAQNTRRKHCVTVNRLLRLAGEPEHDEDESFDLLDRVPTMRCPAEQVGENVEIYTRAEYLALVAAAAAIDVPTRQYLGCDPRIFWPALLGFLWGTAVRISTAMRADWRWIQASWMRVPSRGMKRGRARPVYLNQAVLAAIAPLRPTDGDGPVFHWPQWPRGGSWLDRAFGRLHQLAGIPPDRCLGFHAIRATAATRLILKNPAVAQMHLGHTRLLTMLQHYIANAAMAEVLEELAREDE